MTLHEHKDIMDNLDLIAVANKFVCDPDHRYFMFGKFSPKDAATPLYTGISKSKSKSTQTSGDLGAE